MNRIYEVAGISKQGFSQYAQRQAIFDEKVKNLIVEVDVLRDAVPGCGVEKMYSTLKPNFLGRDRFVELFMELGYRLRHKKNYHRTTYSTSKYYPNLIKGLEVSSPSCIWQSDITYYRIGERFYYLVFIIDVYTKRIVGYSVSDHMRATANLSALEMALKENKPPKYHHSDRGSQYVSKDYTSRLKSVKTKISMGLMAQENPYAERINRTIKEDFLDFWKPESLTDLKGKTRRAVKNYNSIRVHNHLNKLTPEHFEKKWRSLTKKNRPTLTIFDDNN
jgi:putative transposase